MPYMDSNERAQENRSSAWALLAVGGIGLVGVILAFTGVLPIRMGNSYLVYGLLAAVFVLFIVMGFVSMKSAKSYSKRAESEKSLQNTILEWCRENLRAEDVSALAGDNQVVAEEELYFRRVEWLRAKINHQFMNLDQAFVEDFIDEKIYDMIFEKKEQE